ncbi:hypothetical protein LSCM1_07314 [Leishmania martiniquensis]|uniref:Cysteine peptidase B (CPB) n=1 Tax=Leishmania martiniquensis TaxID=1580590 RepID=A0A836H5E7_9TRYP|nr:hypothetical protein LSCM1_07314 [Leishmania martiniquensis]
MAATQRSVALHALPPLGSPTFADAEGCEVAAVSALAALADVTQHHGVVHSPATPAVVGTFAAFLHRIQSASPHPSQAVPLLGSQTARTTPRSRRRDKVVGNGQTPLPVPVAPLLQLLSPADSALHSASSLPSASTPPPPYVETSTPQAAFGTGTFAPPPALVRHVRLPLRWAAVAARRRCRVAGDEVEHADGLALEALSPTPLPVPAAGARSSSLSHAPQHGAPSSGSHATTCSSPLADGEVTLVSDHVDAVLPAWAYLSSHIADAVQPTRVMSAPTSTLPRGESFTEAPAVGSQHHRSHSDHSSAASSLVGEGLCPPSLRATASASRDEYVDRQSCLYPSELAEACALAQRRRSESKTVAVAASALSSLHLLRLELQVDVEQSSPTLRNAAPAERQSLLDQALAEFTVTGVLPTTVLRGVLNDAALRLLASVDDLVLRRVAGAADLATQAEVKPHDGGTPSSSAAPATTAQSCCHRVVPLSLHARTLQRKPRTAATAMAGRLPLSTSVLSATASTVSGTTDSPLRMPTGPTILLTRLILTVLVHQQQTLATFTAPEARVVPAVQEGQAPLTNGQDGVGAPAASGACSPSSSETDATARMDDNAAVSLASAIIPHLFPFSFALSRFTKKLSLSSAVGYEALRTEAAIIGAAGLCGSAAGAAEEDAAAAAAEISETRVSEFGDGATATMMGAGTRSAGVDTPTQPWTWQDIAVSAVRAMCGLPELKSLPTPAAMMPFFSSPSTFSQAACSVAAGVAETATRSTTLTPQLMSERWRPSNTMVAEATTAVTTVAEGVGVTAAADSVHASEAVIDPAADQGVERECHGPSRLAEENQEKVEIGAGSAIDDSPRRWEADKATAALTSVVEAVHCRVGALCGQLKLLSAFMETSEAETEAGDGDADAGSNGAASYGGADSSVKQQKEAPEGLRGTVVPAATYWTSKTDTAHLRRCAGDHACLESVTEAAQQVLVCGLMLLTTTGLSVSEPADSGGAISTTERATAGDSEKRRAGSRILLLSLLATAEGSGGSSVEHTCGTAHELRRWLSVYERYLSEYVCTPLEQLERSMTEAVSGAAATTSAATAASMIREDGNGSWGNVPRTTRRVVPGSVTLVKEARRHHRHRRHAAAVKASLGDEKWYGARVAEEANGSDADSPVLPALSIARATVRLCRTMARTSAPPLDGASAASSKELLSHQPTPTTATGRRGGAAVPDTGSLHQLHCHRRCRCISNSPCAFMLTVGATADSARPLHKRIADLVDTITSVLRLLEAEERRWAALQGPVAGLQGHWRDMWAIINEERAQWCEMAQSSLWALRGQMRSTLAMEKSLGLSLVEVEGVTAVAAAANADPAADALAAESTSALAATVELEELTSPAREPDAFSRRRVALQPTRAPVAAMLLKPNFGEAGLFPAPSPLGLSPEAVTEESAEERATAGAGKGLEVAGEETPVSPALSTPSRESHIKQVEPEAEDGGELQDALLDEAAMVEDSETCEQGGDSIKASAEKLCDKPTATAKAATPSPPPLLSAAAFNRLTTTPGQKHMPQHNQSTHNRHAKQSCRARATQPLPQAPSRRKAAGSRAQTSRNDAAPAAPLRSATVLRAASRGSARSSPQWDLVADAGTVAAAASAEGNLAFALHQLPLLRTLAPLYVDGAVLRQATPFMAIGAVLYLLLLLL